MDEDGDTYEAPPCERPAVKVPPRRVEENVYLERTSAPEPQCRQAPPPRPAKNSPTGKAPKLQHDSEETYIDPNAKKPPQVNREGKPKRTLCRMNPPLRPGPTPAPSPAPNPTPTSSLEEDVYLDPNEGQEGGSDEVYLEPNAACPPPPGVGMKKGPPSRSSSHEAPPPRGGPHETPPPMAGPRGAPPSWAGPHETPPPRVGSREAPPPRGGSHEAPPPRGGSREAPPPRGGSRDAPLPRGGSREALPSRAGSLEAPPPRAGPREAPPPRVGSRVAPPPRGGSHEAPPPRGGSHEAPPPRVGSREALTSWAGPREAPPPRGGSHEAPPPRAGPREAPPPRVGSREALTSWAGPREAPPPRGGSHEAPPPRRGSHEAPTPWGLKTSALPATVEAQLQAEEWFAGNCDRKTAEVVLSRVNKDGAFLVRCSSAQSTRQPYTLVVLFRQKVYNLPIRYLEHNQGYALGKEGKRSEELFSNLQEIISHHKNEPIQLIDSKNQAKHTMFLTHPARP